MKNAAAQTYLKIRLGQRRETIRAYVMGQGAGSSPPYRR